MNRSQILDEAKRVITQDRQDQYGDAEDSFQMIAELWMTYVLHEHGEIVIFEAKDVAMMMALLKVARITCGKAKADNYVDLCGYAALAAEMNQGPDEERPVIDTAKVDATLASLAEMHPEMFKEDGLQFIRSTAWSFPK